MRDAHINEGAINGVIARMLAPDPALSPPGQRQSKKQQQYTEQGELNRLGVGDWTSHDARRTMTTNLMPMGVQEWHVSLLLAHSISGSDHSRSRVTKRHYNLYQYYDEKLAAAEKWCALLAQSGLTVEYLEAAEAVEIADWERRLARRSHRTALGLALRPQAQISA